MKIAFVFPPFSVTPSAPPCGISALSSFLKKQKVKVKFFDLNIEFYNFILEDWDNLKETIYTHFYDLLTNQDLPNEVNDRLDFLCNITIPLISKIKNQRNSKLLLRSIEDLFNEYFFPGIFQQSENIGTHLIGNFSDLLIQIKQKVNDPILKRFIDKFQWDFSNIIAFSLLTEQQFPYSMLIINTLKTKNPNFQFIIGGPYITEIYPHFLEKKLIFRFIKYLVIYEGETALLYILDKEYNNKSFKHPNVISIDTTDIDRDLILLEKIQSNYDQDFSEYNLDLYKKFGNIALPVYSSKGCTWRKCAFCSLNQTQKYREIDINCLILKINKLINETGITTFQLVDEDIYPQRLREIAENINENCSVEIKWFIQTRFYPKLDYNLLKSIYDAGCYSIEFGLESASPKTLIRINKGISLLIVKRILADCEKIGLKVIINCMVGFPGDNETDALELITFLDDVISQYPDLNFSCNTQTVKIYQNSDFGKNPHKYDIKIIKKFDLSPIRTRLEPSWITQFKRQYKSHILFCEKSSSTLKNEKKKMISDELNNVDPLLSLSGNWILLESIDHKNNKFKHDDLKNYLIRIFQNNYQILKITQPVAILANLLVNNKIPLSILKQKFLELYPDYQEEEVISTFGKSIILLNKFCELSFFDN